MTALSRPSFWNSITPFRVILTNRNLAKLSVRCTAELCVRPLAMPTSTGTICSIPLYLTKIASFNVLVRVVTASAKS